VVGGSSNTEKTRGAENREKGFGEASPMFLVCYHKSSDSQLKKGRSRPKGKKVGSPGVGKGGYKETGRKNFFQRVRIGGYRFFI